MKTADVLRETIYPVTDATVLLAIIGFAALGTLAQAAGLFGLWLALIVLPATIRYAMYLLERRAHGKSAVTPGIELFAWVGNAWSLFALVPLAIAIWSSYFLYSRFSLTAAQVAIGVFLLLYPASIAVLGVTRSPLGSLNPHNWYSMIRLCGRDYLWIPLVLVVAMLAVFLLFDTGSWRIVLNISATYIFFLLFTLTGAVLHANRIADQIDIDAPLDASEQVTADALLKHRRKVANHAYGFVSRGNRDGGLAHIRDWVARENDVNAASNWFFREMLRWESKDAALCFAQEYFAYLLGTQDDHGALKLMSSCLHEESRWKPLQRDRDAAVALAGKYGREDLLKSLTS